MRHVFLVGILFLGFSPMGNLDRIRRAFEKLEFEKAYDLIQKAYEKDPSNAGAIYYSALLHSTNSYTGFDLDTARVITEVAQTKFEETDEDDLEDLEEDGVSEEIIEQLRISIRDRIYNRIDTAISVEGAERFMRLYPRSPYSEKLVFRRDSIVFERVKKNDLLGVYEEFLEKYSTEEFRQIAIDRIDELRYQVLVHSGELDDYYEFLRKYPKTNFRDKIEAFIFKTSTIDHKSESYLDFIDFAENPTLIKRAADILYYINDNQSFQHPLRDSIRFVEATKELLLIPAMEKGVFGFHANTGEIQIPYRFEDVDYSYKCELTDDNWLFITSENGNQIVSKSGEPIINELDEYEDLTSGAALVTITDKKYVLHKSGFKIIEEVVEDASVLNGRWLRVKKNGKWALVSFSGHMITDFDFSDIRIEGSFWIFEKEQLLGVYTEKRIEEELNEKGLDLEFKFDDLEMVSDEILIGFRDDRECMLDKDLKFLIPWGVYEINPDESGWYLKTANGYRLYDPSEQDILNEVHPYLETNAGWLALQTTNDWMLLPRTSFLQPSRGYDSLKLLNEYSVFWQKDEERKVLFSNEEEIDLGQDQVQSFFNQQDYLLISGEEKKSVIGANGQILIEGDFEEVTFFNDSLLKVKQKGKNGLLKLDNTYLIPLEYDAIDEDNGLILTLKDGKIGCLDLTNGTLISPSYESRIERVGEYYLVKQNGKFGLVDNDEDSLLSFKYNEIKFWNDTSFLVRSDAEWNFLSHEQEVLEEPVDFLTEIVSTEEESIWKYVKSGKYGLVSNRNGILLSPEFTDIFNIGNTEEPIFFADQHLDKAGFHVVSYLNRSGELLFSKAYTKKEFDKILCDD